MRIRHVLAGATVVAGGLLLTACDWDRTNTFSDSESLSGPVSEVRFANDSGDVKITVGDTFEVHRTVRYHNDKPGKTYHMAGRALVLENCPDRNCGVSYEVTVPKGTRVSGHVDSGDVELTGVARVNVEAESGNITVRDVDGAVNAKTQSGDVDLSDIGGNVVAGAESGNLTVGLTSANAVTATTSSGNVDVTVPKAGYQVDIQTDQDDSDGDDVVNDIGDGTTGPKISLRTDSGSVTLKPA
jgi:major membrane immunogen (membrane-anchored lipoprotein)